MAICAQRSHLIDFLLISQMTTRTLSSSDKSGSLGLEDSSVSSGGCALTLVGLGELSAAVGHLHDVCASEFAVRDNAGADHLNSLSTGTVATGHLVVHLGHGTAERGVTVLLVHVDGKSAGEITENDTVVLDGGGMLLVDLGGGNDLTLNLADLVLSLHVVPELGTSKNGIASKHADSVQLGLLALF